MVGMRHVPIHDYVGVNEAVLWRTIQEDLPSLLVASQAIIHTIDAELIILPTKRTIPNYIPQIRRIFIMRLGQM